MNGKIVTWNTGRQYSEDGQRMSAVCLPTGQVAFMDVARGVDGVTSKVIEESSSDQELQRFVMTEYDAGRYLDGFHVASDIGNSQDVSGFVVMLKLAAKNQIKDGLVEFHAHQTIGEVLDTVSAQPGKVVEDSLNGVNPEMLTITAMYNGDSVTTIIEKGCVLDDGFCWEDENGFKVDVMSVKNLSNIEYFTAEDIRKLDPDYEIPSCFVFNDRTRGIFADGYEDRDGLPVGDTFAYRLRAQLHGAAARNWTKEQNAALVASYSSAEMNEIMNGVEKTISEGANLDVLTANLDRSDLWDGFGNSGMRYMEECDLIGGETDCYPSRYPCYPSTATNALPHEMTFAEFAKIARVEKLENHGRQSEVFIGDKSLGFCDFPGGDDALRQAHAREINNAIYVNAPEAVDFMEKVSFPPAHVLAEYPELMEVWADVLKGREPEVHSKAWFDACWYGDTPPQDLRDFSESFMKKYGVKGICDPMYIVNVTAFELGCGNGRGEFTEGRECLPEKFNRVADRLLFSYSANIQNTSLLTTQEDVTGLLKSAIEAGRAAPGFASTGIHCGAITKNEGGVVTQKVGRAPGDVVQHDCAKLIVGKDPAVVLAVGNVVDIRYSDGVGVVMPQLEIER